MYEQNKKSWLVPLHYITLSKNIYKNIAAVLYSSHYSVINIRENGQPKL